MRFFCQAIFGGPQNQATEMEKSTKQTGDWTSMNQPSEKKKNQTGLLPCDEKIQPPGCP